MLLVCGWACLALRLTVEVSELLLMVGSGRNLEEEDGCLGCPQEGTRTAWAYLPIQLLHVLCAPHHHIVANHFSLEYSEFLPGTLVLTKGDGQW